MLPGLAGISGFGVIKPTTVTYQGLAKTGFNLTNYNFSSQPLGTASADRVVIVFVSSIRASGGHTVSTVTIGGVSATILVQQSSSGLTGALVAAAVPTGTTGDVVVTLSAGGAGCGVGIWSATGLAGAVAVATGSNTNNAALTLSTDPGGFVVAGCAYDYAAAAGDVTNTWSGATEAFEDNFEEDMRFSGASDIISSSSVTVQPTLSETVTPSVFVAATF
jgi:hypothetical protein